LVGALRPPRRRLTYAALLFLTVAVGLASRKFSYLLPWWLAKNAGDVLYAVMAFWLAGLLLPRLSTPRAALATLLFCFGIEFLKFWRTPALETLRHSSGGALVFGRGFHGSNLACYTLGVLLAAGVEVLLRRRELRQGRSAGRLTRHD